MADLARSLDAEVRRVDEDRWLASRFAPRDVRARLAALYALNHEIARTAEVVSEPAVGAIRLAWWREGVSEVLAGQSPRQHPVLAGFANAAREVALSGTTLLALIDARRADLESPAFASRDALEAYVHATAGGVMRLAMEACGQALDRSVEDFTRHAALAWGIAGVLRAESHWRSRGRQIFAEEECSHAGLIERARSAYVEARAIAPSLPSEAFPASGYVTLAPAYLRALQEGRPPPALLSRQLKLIAAAASGRI